MGTIWVKELTGGLDTRRLPETTSGGVLIRAADGHITRGGEFEKRAAMVPEYELPADTVGLAYDSDGIVVFGSDTAPTLPSGVSYQRLQHPDSVTALVRVPSFDLYAGKIYAVGEFADGSVYHFYDGTRVPDWYDGRSRAAFQITGGGVNPAAAASGTFEITGGTSSTGVNVVSDIAIDGVSIIGSPVDHTGNNATTAAAVAAEINSHTSSPDYSASSDGQTVSIVAATTGVGVNGKAIVVTIGGDVTTANNTGMSGGAASTTSTLSSLTVDGVEIIAAPVVWATSNASTAAAIATAINSYTSSPDYTATVVGSTVNIVAALAGTAADGRLVGFGLANGLTVSPSGTLALANGSDSSAFQPGLFVKTVGSKMHSVSGPNEHFSGIQQPTKWTTDTTGAGFIDMSTQASGSEDLTALAKYQNYVAVFAERIIQVWYFDPDPSLNRQVQVLNNTGTASPRSVTQFGDNDLFYQDESGLRSLRARDASNAAATTDIGVPVDSLIIEKLRQLSAEEREQVIGLIEPSNGRFWLIILDQVFVFSFFSGAKVSAWSTYNMTANVVVDDVSSTVTFEVEHAVVFRRRVYLRAGDRIFVYGGLSEEIIYDDTQAEAWLPYLDADTPTEKKPWSGLDAAVEGAWQVSAAMQPVDTDAVDELAIVDRTTYGLQRIPIEGSSTHISLRFKSLGDGPAKLAAAVIHYSSPDGEDG